MNQRELKSFKERIQSSLDLIKNQNSGADIHTIGNIRNRASLLLTQLEDDPDCMGQDLIEAVTKNIEKDVVDFYQKKYGPSKCSR